MKCSAQFLGARIWPANVIAFSGIPASDSPKPRSNSCMRGDVVTAGIHRCRRQRGSIRPVEVRLCGGDAASLQGRKNRRPVHGRRFGFVPGRLRIGQVQLWLDGGAGRGRGMDPRDKHGGDASGYAFTADRCWCR